MANQEWFKSRKWGIFNHYLPDQNSNYLRTKGKPFYASWNECVNNFDVDAYAKALNDTGCGYVIFTMGQGQKYWCAPNEAFNKITGYKTGEACTSRDLISDLIKALKVYGIPLFLYFTGDGPYIDEQAGERMGLRRLSIAEQVGDLFIEHWCMVLREYSLRYGTDVKGWWIDGCYDFIGYNDKYLEKLRKAATAGNPDALVAFNNGTEKKNYNNPKFARFYDQSDCSIRKMEKIEDALLTGLYDAEGYMETEIEVQYRAADNYTAGERTEFKDIPSGKEMPCVWHILSFLGHVTQADPRKIPYQCNGAGWGALGSRYTPEYMRDYVKAVNEKGGVVSIDIAIFRDGTFDIGQIETLRLLKNLK